MKNERSGTSLFLLELLLGLLIFALCAAVCVRFFAASLETAHDTADYTSAVQIAQTIAEQCQSGVPPQAAPNKWNASAEPDEQGEYTAELSVKDTSDGVVDTVITINNSKGKMLYILDFSYMELKS